MITNIFHSGKIDIYRHILFALFISAAVLLFSSCSKNNIAPRSGRIISSAWTDSSTFQVVVIGNAPSDTPGAAAWRNKAKESALIYAQMYIQELFANTGKSISGGNILNERFNDSKKACIMTYSARIR